MIPEAPRDRPKRAKAPREAQEGIKTGRASDRSKQVAEPAAAELAAAAERGKRNQ